jgi:hypothetical protein
MTLSYQNLPYYLQWEALIRLQTIRSQVLFPMVSWVFFIDIILPAALWPGVDSASKRNEY